MRTSVMDELQNLSQIINIFKNVLLFKREMSNVSFLYGYTVLCEILRHVKEML